MNPVVSVALILAGPSGGLADVKPVGRLVTGAGESVLLDKGFQQVNGMAVARCQSALMRRSTWARIWLARLRGADPRQDEKSTVVGNQRQALRALLLPTNQSIDLAERTARPPRQKAGRPNQCP